MEVIRQHKAFFIFESIIFILLGGAAIAIPGLFTLSVELLVGLMFIAAGLMQLFRTFTVPGGGWVKFSTFLSAILYLFVGGWLLFYPLAGVLSLTMLLAILFFLQGLLEISWGISSRAMKNWGWWIFSGLISILMAGIIWYGWPGTAVWVIGLLVGINLLFYGLSLLLVTIEA